MYLCVVIDLYSRKVIAYKEVFRKYFYPTKKAVVKAVEEYVEFYNDYRPHQRLGYLTPNKVEDEYYSQNKTMATSD